MSRWVMAWLGGPLLGIANGLLREKTYGQRLDDRTAHQVSTATAIGGFAAYFGLLQRRWPLQSNDDAVRVGAIWLCLTIAFEFGFGRLVAKMSWQDLLADYNLRRGRTWPLVLAWIAAGPSIVRGTAPGSDARPEEG